MTQDADGSAPMLGSVANYPAKPDGWIPVTERLPEVAETVLIFHRPTDADGRPSCAGTPGCDGGCIETGFWESIEGERHWIGDCGVVSPTHWMPLPAPPTDGK